MQAADAAHNAKLPAAQNRHRPPTHHIEANLGSVSGEGGIRTHGTVSRSGAFKAPALVHYATSPRSTLERQGTVILLCNG